MSLAARLIQSRFLLWVLLTLPALPLLKDFIWRERYYAEIMYESGVWSVELLVLTLSITPITFLLKRLAFGQKIALWLLQRRRYFGVASFGFALIHTYFYIREVGDPFNIWLEAFDPEFLFGWLAFLLMLMLALTSNQWATRTLGRNWKRLQRLVYPASALVLLHWLWFDQFLDVALLWFGILAVMKLVQIMHKFRSTI